MIKAQTPDWKLTGRRRGVLVNRYVYSPGYHNPERKVVVCQVEESGTTVYGGVSGVENRWRDATAADLPNETIIEGY